MSGSCKSLTDDARKLFKRWVIVGGTLAFVLPVLLVHRLALAFDYVLFPTLRDVNVSRPLFVVGPPRSGTTLMHRLLADDQHQFTTFPLWELLLAPALCEKYLLGGIARVDQKLGGHFVKLLKWVERKFSKSLEGVHQTSLFLPEEDYLGLLSYGGCFLAVLVFPKAAWVWRLGNFSDGLSEARQRALVQAYRGLLQRHLYYRGLGRQVLSKNPTFSSWLPRLLEAFPDARFIGLLRSPLEIVPSQLSSVREGVGFFGNDVASPEIRDAFVSLLAGYYRQVWSNLREFPDDQAAIVDYGRLKHSSDEVVVDCLRKLGYHVSSEYRDLMLKRARDVSSYRSGHRYTLDDFNLSVTEIVEAFGDTWSSDKRAELQDEIVHS